MRDDIVYVREKTAIARPQMGPAVPAAPQCIGIVGGGTGTAAAKMLRPLGCAGRVTMPSADVSPPYDRPNTGGKLDLILISSGSEVTLVPAAGRLLASEHIATSRPRTIVTPCCRLRSRHAVDAGATTRAYGFTVDNVCARARSLLRR